MAEETYTLDTRVIDKLIVGRIEPYIYAFTTETVPNYLKVGDTGRPLHLRLKEWRNVYPQLQHCYQHIAKAKEGLYFRDFAVHTFLEQEKGRKRLQRDTFPDVYYSREFFEEATPADIDEAIEDIEASAKANDGRYQFMNADRLVEVHTYDRTASFDPRPNQAKTIENFAAAIANGHTNLLMYAVMRFGKSFTAMCCAVEMKAKFVVVVSAKADVAEEWKKTVQTHVRFEGYQFLTKADLQTDYKKISNALEDGEKIVLFLTLQDLQGRAIKKHHAEVFQKEIDLLLIDESHFGARAEEYGRVLRVQGEKAADEKFENEFVQDEISDGITDEVVKTLRAKVRLHLSGTPYRILMGSEFSKEDMIACYQFADIVDEQRKWDEAHLYDDDTKEWDNPYFGFPQMIRFAFHPNRSTIAKLKALRDNGNTYAFNALLRPQSVQKDDKGAYKQFKHEAEILDLLRIIDGSAHDENILSFLDYPKLKEGKMCRHIVCVLPFRASCDAMEALLKKHHKEFKNLGEYEIINISGVDAASTYPNNSDVTTKIARCEREGKKTLTLTVNRMLTGSTVPEWDTMIYLKDTTSPQEYDQAVFRLQNQYVTTHQATSGEGEIKINRKPQTLLVDFDPDRLFRLQELKSHIYNANQETNGNSMLKTRIEKDLTISPVITINAGKMEQITPDNIMDAVRRYSMNRGVMEEATDIPVDMALLDIPEVLDAIREQTEIDAAKGLELHQTDPEEGGNLELPEQGQPPQPTNRPDPTGQPDHTPTEQESKSLEKQFRTYYAMILFFAFLTNTKVESLSDVIAAIKSSEENKRIAGNLGLKLRVLQWMQARGHYNMLRELDYKIANINTLIRDEDKLTPIERARTAMKQFGRLSTSEIITPPQIASKMVAMLPKEELLKERLPRFLDIAAKQGEFALALIDYFGDEVKEQIYSLPTSKVSYEFTRKIYELLEMPVEHIMTDFTTFDLIGENKETNIKQLQDMKFDVVVGNPPYQTEQQATSDDPIFHLIIDASYEVANKAVLISPARFLFNAGKTPKQWNQKMLSDPHLKVAAYAPKSGDLFPGIDLKGGLAITIHDKEQEFGAIKTFTAFPELNDILHKVLGKKGFVGIDTLIYQQNKFNLKKLYEVHPHYKSIIGSGGREKRLTTPIFEQIDAFTETAYPQQDICVLGLIRNERFYRHIPEPFLDEHPNLHKYKVLVPAGNGSGAIGEVLSTPLIGEPLIGYTQSFIGFGKFETQQEAEACLKYVKTRFARTLLGTLKVTQHNHKDTWRNVPLQDFTAQSDIDWSKSIPEIDQQLYAKYGLSSAEIAFIESKIKPME